MNFILLNTFAEETILRYPSIVTLALFVIGAIIAIGVYKSIISRLLLDVEKHTEDIHELKDWGEQEIADAKRERELYYVRKDVFNQCLEGINRRLDAFDALEIGAQLAEIKTLLMALKEQLKNK